MAPVDQPQLPTLSQLWRATAIAVAVAAVLLVTIVLPAEFGIDVTGAGAALGLYRAPASTPEEAAAAESAGVPASSGSSSTRTTLVRRPAAFRSDETTIVLKSGEGTERKAIMAAGETLVYSWRAEGGGVDVDMHGEFASARDDEFTSYWKDEEQVADHGVFTAPAAGQHGWFWQNLNDQPVTITLKTSGFYDRIIIP